MYIKRISFLSQLARDHQASPAEQGPTFRVIHIFSYGILKDDEADRI